MLLMLKTPNFGAVIETAVYVIGRLDSCAQTICNRDPLQEISGNKQTGIAL